MTIICCILIAFPVKVQAEIKEKNVYYLDKDGGTFYISIMFEKSDLRLSLKDPDDNEVSLNSSDVEYVQSDSTVFIIVRNAKRGQWKLIYDKGSNDELQVAAYAEEEPMVIDSLKVGNIDEECNIPVSFRVSQPDGRNYNYEIRLGTDENMDDYRVLGTGYGYEGEITETKVSLKDVNSYDNYYLQIFAYYDKDYMRYVGMVTSNSFAFSNPTDEPDAIEDYKVTVNPITKSVDIDISEYATWEDKSYCIDYKVDGSEAEQLIAIREDSGDIATIEYKDGAKVVECSVTVQNSSGRISKPLKKTIYLTARPDKFWMELPESDTINSTNYTFSYENAIEQTVYTKIDDQREEEFVLNDGGNHLIPVGDTSCSLRIRYQADDNIWYSYDVIVTVDVIPPDLKIYEALNGIVTDEKNIILTGKTEADAVLMVNDTETEKNEDGSFSLNLDLTDGENDFKITSTDTAGNISTYAFAITYSKNGTPPDDVDADLDDTDGGGNGFKAGAFGKWLWLVALIYFFVMALTTFLVVFIGMKKRDIKQNLFRGALTAICFSAVGFIADLIYYISRKNFQSSEKYIDMSANNIHEAYSYLSVTKFAGTLLIVAILLILASVGVILFTKLSGKKFETPGFIKKASEKAAEWKKQNNEPWTMQTPDAWKTPEAGQSTETPTESDNGQQSSQDDGEWTTCKQCGARIKMQAKFCDKCGFPNG